MGPGDCLMSRDMWGSGDPMEDVAQAWVMPRYVHVSASDEVILTTYRDMIGTDLKKLMDQTRLAVLGERKDRDAMKSRKVNGVWTGGTAAERHDQAVNIDKSERCYTWGQSFQVLKKLVGPSVGSKVHEHDYNTHHEMRRDTLNVGSCRARIRQKLKFYIQAAAQLGIAALESGPEKISKQLRTHSSNMGMPRLGYHDNYGFSTFQGNIASTKRASELACEHSSDSMCVLMLKQSWKASEFTNDLGPLAEMHIDRNDHPGGYTCMITYSDLADDDHPGWFMLAELGVAISTSSWIASQ